MNDGLREGCMGVIEFMDSELMGADRVFLAADQLTAPVAGCVGCAGCAGCVKVDGGGVNVDCGGAENVDCGGGEKVDG